MTMDRNTAIVSSVVVACITLLLWGIFIWPTPYRYEKVSRLWYNGTKQVVYRVNRFTGHSELVVDPIPSKSSSQ